MIYRAFKLVDDCSGLSPKGFVLSPIPPLYDTDDSSIWGGCYNECREKLSEHIREKSVAPDRFVILQVFEGVKIGVEIDD